MHLSPWTKGHLAGYPGVAPHLRQQKPSERRCAWASLPAGLLSPRVTLLSPPCPVFCRCFPAGLSCRAPFMQRHVWPQKWLSVKPSQVPGSASPCPRGHSRVLGCQSLHRPRQVSPCWSQSTLITEVFPACFKLNFLMILTGLRTAPRVQVDSFKKIKID